MNIEDEKVIDADKLNKKLQEKNEQLEVLLNQTRDAQFSLDRRIYHLKTVNELAAELSRITQVEKILNTFLLMTMGTFSAGQGFILFYNRNEKQFETASRGMSKCDMSIENVEKLIYQSYEASEDKSLSPMSVSQLNDTSHLSNIEFSHQPETALFFVIDRESLGIIALGSKITGENHNQEEIDLLSAHISSFMGYLENARSFETIQKLNTDLEKRNYELEKTIRELTEAKKTIAVLEKAKDRIKALIQRESERVGRLSPVDFIIIPAVTLIIALLFNFSSPNRIPLFPESLFKPPPAFVEVIKAKELFDSHEAIIIDARPRHFYKTKHIKGAINLTPALFDFIYMMKLAQEDSEKPIIVYGRNISSRYDEEIIRMLKNRDHENVSLMKGGLSVWEKQGFPVESEE